MEMDHLGEKGGSADGGSMGVAGGEAVTAPLSMLMCLNTQSPVLIAV